MRPISVKISRSPRKDKKLVAEFVYANGKTKKTHFGGRGYSDYTKHKDPRRKERYLRRHQRNENWNDPTTAGALSRWILWNKPNLNASIQDFENRFNLSAKQYNKSRFHPCVVEASQKTGLSKEIHQASFDRGWGAANSNPQSVRNRYNGKKRPGGWPKGVRMSNTQWACARTKQLRKGKNYDQDLLRDAD